MSINRIGPTILYEPKDRAATIVDFVFVHGLFGHPKKTWTLHKPDVCLTQRPSDNDTASDDSSCGDHERPPKKMRRAEGKELFSEVFWPRDLLPKIFPAARIVTWGYDAQVEHLWKSTSQASIFNHSENLLSDIVMLRNEKSARLRPLIFVAHSLGGIVVKDALCHSAHEQESLRDVLSATVGVMFLGTPHHGSKVASLGKMAFNISKAFFKSPNVQILRTLEENSEILERVSRDFGRILVGKTFNVHSFREELPTKGVMIVGPSSSAIGYFHETQGSLYANHRNMAKFASLDDVKFRRVVSVIQRWMSTVSESFPHSSCPILPRESEIYPDGLIFDREFRLCQQSLKSPEAQTRYDDIDAAYEETYNWLFQGQVEFENWLQGKISNPIYWIQGKPGSGKSTVMKFALNHSFTMHHLLKYSNRQWILGSFFFHDRGTSMQKTTFGFLRHVLYQILHQQKRLFTYVYPIFNKVLEHNEQTISRYLPLKESWSLNLLHEALMIIGHQQTAEVNLCLFVDALDEHDEDHKGLITILRDITSLSGNPSFRLRLVLASRPENIFKTAFQQTPGFAIHEFTTTDIEKYVQGKIKTDLPADMEILDRGGLENLVTVIVRQSNGVFLWARLVTDEILEGLGDGDTIEEIVSLLSTIPTELGDLYSRALRRSTRSSMQASQRNKNEAYIMFQLAISALQPFSLFEFVSAAYYLSTMGKSYPDQHLERLSEMQMERRLNSRSCGLLECTKTLSVQFIHQTVKEFIKGDHGQNVITTTLGPKHLESGTSLIFRYILKLFDSFTSNALDLAAQSFVINNFMSYAIILEFDERLSIAASFESTLGRLPVKLRHDVMVQILDKVHEENSSYNGRTILRNMRMQPTMQYPLFYLLCDLPMSLEKSLVAQPLSQRQDWCLILLEALVVMVRGEFDTTPLSRILLGKYQIETVVKENQLLFEEVFDGMMSFLDGRNVTDAQPADQASEGDYSNSARSEDELPRWQQEESFDGL